MDDEVGDVLLGDPLALGVEEAGQGSGLLPGQLLAEPGDLGAPPLLGKLFEFLNQQSIVPVKGNRRDRLFFCFGKGGSGESRAGGEREGGTEASAAEEGILLKGVDG